MQFKDQTASYVELSSQTFSLLTDAMSAYNKRILEYSKSLWEISSRPYSSTAVETTMRENFDRTNQIVSLSIHELQTNGQKSTELAEKLVAHGTKLQETMMNSMKGFVETNISNMNFAKDSATQQFENITKRLEATTVSAK